jgi:hypothetical protein
MRFRQFLEMLSLACPQGRGHDHSTHDAKAGARFIRIPSFPRRRSSRGTSNRDEGTPIRHRAVFDQHLSDLGRRLGWPTITVPRIRRISLATS